MQNAYDILAHLYDGMHGNRTKTIHYLLQLFRQYHPNATSLLSLACGTGKVCSALSSFYQIAGIDLSENMLARAKKRLPSSEFYQQNIVDFELPDQSFDIIACVFGGLNHLHTLQDWQSCFQHVYDHLKPGGIWVFDILTPVGFYNTVLNSPLQFKVGRNSVTARLEIDENAQPVWSIHGKRKKLFRKKEHELFQTALTMQAFDHHLIENTLSNIFSEVNAFDPEQNTVNENSELIYYVCLK